MDSRVSKSSKRIAMNKKMREQKLLALAMIVISALMLVACAIWGEDATGVVLVCIMGIGLFFSKKVWIF